MGFSTKISQRTFQNSEWRLKSSCFLRIKEGTLAYVQTPSPDLGVVGGLISLGAALILAMSTACRPVIEFRLQEIETETGASSNQSTPATLAVTGGFNGDFGSLLLTTTRERTLALTNTGTLAATQVHADFMAQPGFPFFRFKGGSYPGVGGTCTSTLAAGASCTLVITYTASTTGVRNSTLGAVYHDGSEPRFANLITATGIGLVGSVSAGAGHSCAVMPGGTAKCWGHNATGKLGLEDLVDRGGSPGEMGNALPAVDLGTGVTAKLVSSGYHHNCAILHNDQVKCWGINLWGNLGLGDNTARGDVAGTMGDNLPVVDLGPGRSAIALALGMFHTCALLDTGQVKCWGNNGWGNLGLGDTQARGAAAGQMGANLPAVDLGPGYRAISIAAGARHTCAVLDDGRVKCWGYNASGQLGLGDLDDRGGQANQMGLQLPAVNLGTGRSALAVTAGESHTCALLTDGAVKCWGENTVGQLGVGDVQGRGAQAQDMGDALPSVNLGPGRIATQVKAGYNFTCAILDNQSTKCWGENQDGQLGIEDPDRRGIDPDDMGANLPSLNPGTGRTIQVLGTGNSHSCAYLDNLSVKCWGNNFAGGLGTGDTDSRGNQAGEMGDALLPVDLGDE